MIGPVQLIRLLRINFILLSHGLTPPVVGEKSTVLKTLSYLNPWRFSQKNRTRGETVRIALEKLGPIFVKFGQLLSTRRDLLPDDISDELAKLQDQVPPFPGVLARKIIETELKKPLSEIFAVFDETPLASASIAQVHSATLHNGADVVIKVLRPNIHRTISHDIALLYLAAKLAQRFWHKSRRLKPIALVSEFEQTILDEMDLNREAANASQLRRNFEKSTMMYVPKIHWSLVTQNVMGMERIYGVRISDVETLVRAGTDMQKLAEYGVEIFFTQVLRDSFFHADMHPGNLFVDITDPKNPRYLGVDFGIMGTLSPEDQHYLAANLLAFFNRDYRQVARLHVESGWVPASTRIDQFESAIRTVCEPIFEKPLKEISFGNLLLQLFRVAEHFNMELQPQLMLLQKTLLSIEGLGRQLYPDLDLWKTAKPLLEKWARKRHSVRAFLKSAITNFSDQSENLLQTPSILFEILQQIRHDQLTRKNQSPVIPTTTGNSRSLFFGAGLAFTATTVAYSYLLYTTHFGSLTAVWIQGALALASFFLGWASPKKSSTLL